MGKRQRRRLREVGLHKQPHQKKAEFLAVVATQLRAELAATLERIPAR